MDKTWLDNAIEKYAPTWGAKRLASRIATEEATRAYNAATKGRRRGNMNSIATNASMEASKYSQTLANIVQDQVRNNPLAQRIKSIYATNIVGSGITFDVTAKNKKIGKEFSKVLMKHLNSTDIDFDGHNNFSGLLWLNFATIVESGACFIRVHINLKRKDLLLPIQFQLIDQKYLDGTKDKYLDDDGQIVDGIKYDADGQIEGYWIDIDPSGLNRNTYNNSKFYGRDQIFHCFRKERNGQHLGISWMAQIAPLLDKYDTLQDAKIMQQQVAACLAVLIENAEGTKIGSDQQPLIDKIQPAMIEKLKPGEKATVVTPPRADDAKDFTYQIKADIAVGPGLNHQMLTGDFSNFNFASGRMGQIEFNKTLDTIQNFMAVPLIDWMMDKIIKVYSMKYLVNTEIEIQPVFPPRIAVDPTAELEFEIGKVRSGASTPQLFTKKFGIQYEVVLEKWEEFIKEAEKHSNLSFDIMPNKFSKAGNQLDDNDAASSNAESNNNAKSDSKSTNNDDNKDSDKS